MADTAHCIFCFETLVASLEDREGISFQGVQESWSQYQAAGDDEADEAEEAEVASTNDLPLAPIPPSTLVQPTFSRLQAPLASSTSSTPSSSSSILSGAEGASSKSSSKSSLFSFSRQQKASPAEAPSYPLFVTWNTISSRGTKRLRGCIGTFEPKRLDAGLKSYALTSAFDDPRFDPIVAAELPSLAVAITLLSAFTPCADALDWTIGTHGLRLTFADKGRRYSATYLPHVAPDQGWTKPETIVNLMRKAGWGGRAGASGEAWRRVADFRAVRYEGLPAAADYAQWAAWRAWVEGKA